MKNAPLELSWQSKLRIQMCLKAASYKFVKQICYKYITKYFVYSNLTVNLQTMITKYIMWYVLCKVAECHEVHFSFTQAKWDFS